MTVIFYYHYKSAVSTYQFFLYGLDPLNSLLYVGFLAGDGDDIAFAVLAGKVDPGLRLIADASDVGTALTNDILVELFEDVDFGNKVVGHLEKQI